MTTTTTRMAAAAARRRAALRSRRCSRCSAKRRFAGGRLLRRRLAILGDGPSAGASTRSSAAPTDVWRLVDGGARRRFRWLRLLAPLRAVPSPTTHRGRSSRMWRSCTRRRRARRRALAAAAREARAVLRFRSATQADTCTGVPFASHTTLLSGVLVPRPHARAPSLPARRARNFARALLSAADTAGGPPFVLDGGPHFHRRTRRRTNCLTTPRCCSEMAAAAAAGCPRRRWPRARASRAGLAAAAGRPADGRGGGDGGARRFALALERMFATTTAKLLSLTAQFCKSVPSKAAALVVLGLLPTTVRSPTVMTTLTEAALQAYLNHCGSEEASGGGAELLDFASEPLAVMGAAMASAPELSLAAAVERCISQQAPLSLRLLLALQPHSTTRRRWRGYPPPSPPSAPPRAAASHPRVRAPPSLVLVVDVWPRGVWPVLSGCRHTHRLFARRPGGVRPRVAVGGDSARRGAAERGDAARRPRGPPLPQPCGARERHGRLSRPPSVAFGDRRELRAQASALLKAPQRDAAAPRAPNFFSAMRMLRAARPCRSPRASARWCERAAMARTSPSRECVYGSLFALR